MLKTFNGFKGKIVFGQIDDCKFVIMAQTPAQLAALWSAIMGDLPFDPAGISNAILIESATLPTPKGLRNKAQGCEPRATLGTHPAKTPPNPEGVASPIIEV